MTHVMKRRDFLASSLAAGAGLALTGGPAGAAEFRTKIKKALIVGKVEEKSLLQIKEAGFDGVECRVWNASPAEAEKARAIAEKCGMRIHSVMRGWANFNKPESVEADVESMKTALAAAKGYGADAVLLVPCRLGKLKMPEPWEFDIKFDKKTSHLKRVVKGDNAPYREYIEAHDRSSDMSREALKRLIPAAEKAKVVIAVENVWNNMWVKPDLAAHFVRSLGSPWIQYYLDIGNHVKYAPPEEWIRATGKTIVKVHIKDFKLNPDGHGGKFVDIRDGSVDWPLVRKELDKIGYNGWATIEGSGKLSMEERNKRLNLIVAGK